MRPHLLPRGRHGGALLCLLCCAVPLECPLSSHRRAHQAPAHAMWIAAVPAPHSSPSTGAAGQVQQAPVWRGEPAAAGRIRLPGLLALVRAGRHQHSGDAAAGRRAAHLGGAARGGGQAVGPRRRLAAPRVCRRVSSLGWTKPWQAARRPWAGRRSSPPCNTDHMPAPSAWLLPPLKQPHRHLQPRALFPLLRLLRSGRWRGAAGGDWAGEGQRQLSGRVAVQASGSLMVDQSGASPRPSPLSCRASPPVPAPLPRGAAGPRDHSVQAGHRGGRRLRAPVLRRARGVSSEAVQCSASPAQSSVAPWAGSADGVGVLPCCPCSPTAPVPLPPLRLPPPHPSRSFGGAVFPIKTGVPERVKRRVCAPDPFQQIGLVPYVETVHNRLTVEIRRGCTRGCR